VRNAVTRRGVPLLVGYVPMAAAAAAAAAAAGPAVAVER